MAYDPSLGKTSEDFRFIFTDREAIGKNKQKIRSHLRPVPQVRCTPNIFFLAQISKFSKISQKTKNFKKTENFQKKFAKILNFK